MNVIVQGKARIHHTYKFHTNDAPNCYKRLTGIYFMLAVLVVLLHYAQNGI